MLFRTLLHSAVAIIATVVAVPSLAQPLPPEIQEMFAELGIEVDENGEVVAPPPPATPPEPVEPMSPEELFALLGLEVDENGIPIPVMPSSPPAPPAPAPPTDPIEFLIEIGVLPEDFTTPLLPDPVVDDPPLVEETPPSPPVAGPEDLFALLGIEVDENGVLIPQTPPALPPSETPPIDPLQQLVALGILPADFPGLALPAASNLTVPEPSAALLCLAAGLSLGFRRRR